jgi:hypothetical protein
MTTTSFQCAFRIPRSAFPARLLALGLLLTALTGCHAVYTEQPIGATPAKLDPKTVNGLWIWDNGAMMVKVADPEKGRLALAWIDDKNDTFTLRTTTAFVREYHDLALLTMQDVEHADHPDRPEWIWLGAVKHDGNGGLLWIPNWKRIGGLVREGKLPGKSSGEDADVYLGKLTPAQTDALTTVGMLLWDDPTLLKKVGK